MHFALILNAEEGIFWYLGFRPFRSFIMQLHLILMPERENIEPQTSTIPLPLPNDEVGRG